MDMLTKKLHSNRGASMLMALLLMLVALMASAVMVSAAVSAANSIREDRAQQQAYLTVSSAAELLRTELEDGDCDSSVTDRYVYSDRNRKTLVRTDYNYGESTWGSGEFASIVAEGIEYLGTNSTGTYTGTYTIEADGYDTVTAEFYMKMGEDADKHAIYTLTVCFYGGEKPHQCRMYLTAQGKITTGNPVDAGSARELVSNYRREWRYYKTATTTTAWQSVKLQRKVG